MHSLIMSAPMVRAMLAGKKTMTRRICKAEITTSGVWYPAINGKHSRHYANETHFRRGVVDDFCPLPVGTEIYIRETWRMSSWDDEKFSVLYRATKDRIEFPRNQMPRLTDRDEWGHWRPSIHMPAWAARLYRRIAAVKVERVQEISEEDAEAEGYNGDLFLCDHCAHPSHYEMNAPRWFRELWQTLYSKPGERWKDNPWTWAYTMEEL